ncbi:arabinan endo-1,5-alpha-L-arabinosidase [Pedobacter sp. UYP24]
MRYKLPTLFIIAALFSLTTTAQILKTNIGAHDPVMIKQDNTYYLFCTAKGIAVWSSLDRVNWKPEKPVFSQSPEWAVSTIPGFKGNIWAPDISFYNGLYYLYYAISTFGSNKSAIGVATNPTLNTSDVAYRWTDHGKVIESTPGLTNWNAIDPNLITDKKGNPYLAFGSFWGGLQLLPLSADRLHPAYPGILPQTIASRKKEEGKANPIEAPFVFKKGSYFYLFASIDFCCRGPESTYKMIVGRSKTLTGPYLDKDGIEMAKGGGTVLLAGNKDWYGVGHNAVCTFDRLDYLIFHGYSAAEGGAPKLLIRKIDWIKGWPVTKL